MEDHTATFCKEEVLFNTDTLSKIISYLPSVDLLSLALTCKRFGLSNNDEQCLIEKGTCIAIQNTATEEELATLPCYNGENSLANYYYLEFMRRPLTFDQRIGRAKYLSGDKSCVLVGNGIYGGSAWHTALSNSILRAGKHYVTFEVQREDMPANPNPIGVLVGVMRPGQINQKMAYLAPHQNGFFQHFSPSIGCNNNNNKVQYCLYDTYTGKCQSSNWEGHIESESWDGMENISFSTAEIGMLLDLDEGTLSVYKNGRKLGVMKEGLAGSYCWVVCMLRGTSVTIKRGTNPSS